MKYQIPLSFGLLLSASIFSVTGCSQQIQTTFVEPSNEKLHERGNYAMWQGRWSDAAVDFSKAVKLHPGDWEAQYRLGTCYLELGEPQRASQSLAIAESLRPSDYMVSNLYAEALLQSGDRNKLYMYLLQRAQTHQTVRDWIVFAEYTMDLDDPDSSTNAINTAIDISNGTDARPYIIAATYAERLGDDNLAITRWSEAWMIEPMNDDISNALRAHGIVPGPTMTGVDDNSQ